MNAVDADVIARHEEQIAALDDFIAEIGARMVNHPAITWTTRQAVMHLLVGDRELISEAIRDNKSRALRLVKGEQQ